MTSACAEADVMAPWWAEAEGRPAGWVEAEGAVPGRAGAEGVVSERGEAGAGAVDAATAPGADDCDRCVTIRPDTSRCVCHS
ncbi:hypothetical protein GT044_05730, partial [Streptomyces sp. SID335]|uniref:hypothetical protein n=1 Tax=Streptomyces sp. SID335 TaxID=2690261 RepID=UPI00136F349B